MSALQRNTILRVGIARERASGHNLITYCIMRLGSLTDVLALTLVCSRSSLRTPGRNFGCRFLDPDPDLVSSLTLVIYPLAL